MSSIEYKLMNIYDLEDLTEDLTTRGILFCFGTSFVSRVIQAKTRLNKNELVPSHVALYSLNNIYESTTGEEKIGYKTIKQGVRRWLTEDFIKAEKTKLTKYIYIPYGWSDKYADSFVHLPYGKDTILEFLLKDGSEGESHGLICSQYVNLCTKIMPNKKCPTPADLFRKLKQDLKIEVYE